MQISYLFFAVISHYPFKLSHLTLSQLVSERTKQMKTLHKFKTSSAATGFLRGVQFVNDSDVNAQFKRSNPGESYPFHVLVTDNLDDNEENGDDIHPELQLHDF